MVLLFNVIPIKQRITKRNSYSDKKGAEENFEGGEESFILGLKNSSKLLLYLKGERGLMIEMSVVLIIEGDITVFLDRKMIVKDLKI